MTPRALAIVEAAIEQRRAVRALFANYSPANVSGTVSAGKGLEALLDAEIAERDAVAARAQTPATPTEDDGA
jgi:hypothetical protein